MDGENDSPPTATGGLSPDETSAPIRYTGLWIGLATVIVVSFAVLGYYGGEVYRLAPPLGWFVVGLKTGWSITGERDDLTRPFLPTTVAEQSELAR
jgi:nitric oxide reductase subunit B